MGQEERKAEIRSKLATAREKTLWLFDQVPTEFLKKRVHSFYSPIGWHFGHIARTEEFWVICEALKRPCLNEHYTFLFADTPENPKDNRVNLPDIEVIKEYLATTRKMTLEALEAADLESDDVFMADGYGWEFALQHECQHQETITEMMQLIQMEQGEFTSVESVPWHSSHQTEWVSVSGGPFCMGSDNPHGYDNEKSEHQVKVEPFEIAQTPVTAYQWSEFIEDGGYANKSLWSDEGWAWREQENATMPEYWRKIDGQYCFVGPHGLRAIHPDEPAGCISWYEADAFARWAEKRLLTEEEWEFAAAYDPATGESRRYPWGTELAGQEHASHGLKNWGPQPVGSHPAGRSALGIDDMAGGVWEFTSTKFAPYPGFQAFPYDGYSKDHMNGKHYVCRGGSWATAAPILRCSFRNWYVPTYRQGFLGVRLAR